MQNELNTFLQVYIDELIERYPLLQEIEEDIIKGYLLLQNCYESKNKLLIAGNGGSAADAEHIVGELMKEFKLPRFLDDQMKERLVHTDSKLGTVLGNTLRQSLRAISLNGHPALSSACLNDVNGEIAFAQQINGLADVGDVFLAISTSGNSQNIIYAALTAKAYGMKVLALTGRDGGMLKSLSDVSVVVPEKETYVIQEYHLPIYHCWCLMLEKFFFG